jgi:hypothetical protein
VLRRLVPWWPAATVLMGVALATTACSQSGPTHAHVSTAVVRHFAGAPRNAMPSCDGTLPQPEPCLTSAGAGTVYVTTWGSGSCPLIPTAVTTRHGTQVISNHRQTSGSNMISRTS